MQVFLGLLFNENGDILLSAEESRHCIKVLRHNAGDVINIIDGKGNFYEAEITSANPQNCTAKIKSKKQIGLSKPYYLHIAISPTKNPDRIEWMIEKCTEMGVDEFSFIVCKRTEKTGAKIDRFKKIAESAVKQSVQGIIPKLNEAIVLKDFIALQKNSIAKKYIAHCLEENKTELKNILAEKNILVLIGPEGDFTEEEIKLALSDNFEALSLGQSRLRTETAGLYTAAAFKTLNP
ncbi:MAG TPA: 16S rRNA (uracil(1498)-N(3))-methyltransferase [Bacteroidia bacterium]|jgi:16S rRNA (uracil1498-N3)-methyltransferase|nr:16S rRNA (uracil(1498)-N(3))-methyltransferase [Bacteroidia bacterium]